MSLALNSRFQESCVSSQHINLGQSLQHEKKGQDKVWVYQRRISKGRRKEEGGVEWAGDRIWLKNTMASFYLLCLSMALVGTLQNNTLCKA